MIATLYQRLFRLPHALLLLLAVSTRGRRDLSSPPGWDLVWSDEFDFFDPSKWEHQYEDGCSLGVCAWGNKERGWYTNANTLYQNGTLTIEVREEHGESKARLEQICWDRCGAQCAGDWNVPPEHVPGCVQDCGRSRCPGVKFSSSRIRTFSKFSIAPAYSGPAKSIRIEARIKLDCGDGMWPAFWLLPEEGSTRHCSGCGKYGPWPSSGEIDVMEMFGGKENSKVHGTVHYGGVGQWSHRTFSNQLTSKEMEAFHVYGIEWGMSSIKFFIDGKKYGEARKATDHSPGWWSAGNANGPFDTNFHLLLNLAAGGEYTNNTPDEVISDTIRKGRSKMEIDWVRVYSST